MLHITNGDEAARAIKEAGVGGDILAWRDALHEGPVPAGLSTRELRETRARFMSLHGWGTYEGILADLAKRDERLSRAPADREAVLWFEHDLYDQLQLLQVIDVLTQNGSRPARIALVQADTYLTELSSEDLAELFETRDAVTPDQETLARRAWKAFRAPDPSGLAGMAREAGSILPYLPAAFLRHLEEFPSVSNGLSRAEAQALDVADAGRKTLGEIYAISHREQEEAVFMSDSVFAILLERMSHHGRPLLVFENDKPVLAPRKETEAAAFWKARAKLTPAGRDVLEGRRDWVKIHKMDRWLGGVRLMGNHVGWRWNDAARELQEDEELERHRAGDTLADRIPGRGGGFDDDEG
jgi:hypothetical protein